MTPAEAGAALARAAARRASLERLRGHPAWYGGESARRGASAEVDRLARVVRAGSSTGDVE